MMRRMAGERGEEDGRLTSLKLEVEMTRVLPKLITRLATTMIGKRQSLVKHNGGPILGF